MSRIRLSSAPDGFCQLAQQENQPCRRQQAGTHDAVGKGGYDGNFVCSGGMRVLPVWTSDPQSLCQQSEMQQQPSSNPFDQSSQPQQQPQQQPAQQEQKDSDGVAGWIKDMFGSN